MQVQTHLLASWGVANAVGQTARDRLLIVIAGVAPDLDGLGLLAGTEYYAAYHQQLCHNLLFIVLSAAVLSVWSEHRLRTIACCTLAGVIHLVLDWLGSGDGWSFHVLAPSLGPEVHTLGLWQLVSWQNLMVDLAFLGVTIGILVGNRRFLLEAIAPELDKKIVRWATSYRR